MAVCKKCGCAIPLGSKSCDMCAAVGAVAPAYQPQVSPPTAPIRVPVASTPPPAGSPTPPPAGWSYATARPAPIPAAQPAQIQRAEKEVRSAWRWLAIVGTMYIALGALTALGYMDDLNGLFGWWAVGIGATFLVLAYFVRQGAILALVIAIAIYTLYTIAFFTAGSFAFFRIIVLAWLLRSLFSMYTVRQHRRAQAQQPPAPDQTRVA